jgi:phage shock protein PspC (stress-responsive transcriptional regulator)
MLVELGVAAYIASYLILEEEEGYEEDEFDDAD